MKTFKLKQLEIVDYKADTYETIPVPLIDGLIINREDTENRWLMEAFVNRDQLDLFTELKDNYEEIIVHVKITTELNELATCITSIIGINEIGSNINVLLLGKLVDKRTAKLEKLLKELVKEGKRGKKLLSTFKGKI